MRATLNIPDKLIDEVQELSGERTKTKAIIRAMEDFIRHERKDKLLALRGKLKIEYDWCKEEQAELAAQKKREEIIEP